MRRWDSLTTWADLEFRAASFYVRRLSPTAVGFVEGTAALWRNPDLANALRWRQENQPTAAWAEQYNTLFPEVMEFLDRSECAETERQAKERKTQRRTKIAAFVFAGLAAVAIGSGVLAWMENSKAERNLLSAESAVDSLLGVVNGQGPLSETPAVPGLEKIRIESLNSAIAFYNNLGQFNADNETWKNGAAIASLENAQMDVRSSNFTQAAADSKAAIGWFTGLASQYPSKPIYREQLANSNMLLGETYRLSGSDPATAQTSYGQAITILQQLLQAYPKSDSAPEYTQELARTYFNRGILLHFLGNSLKDQSKWDASKSDFDNAVKLLQPFQSDPKHTDAAWDLARAFNNRANLLADENQNSAAQSDYVQATQIGEALFKSGAYTPDYELELAKYCDNLSSFYEFTGDDKDAQLAAAQAESLVEDLSKPASPVSLEQAKILAMLGAMVEPENRAEAGTEYKNSFNILEALKKANAGSQLGVDFTNMLTYLANNYLELAGDSFDAHDLTGAKNAAQFVTQLLPDVSVAAKGDITNKLALLQKKLY
jgi:hypothetical protein